MPGACQSRVGGCGWADGLERHQVRPRPIGLRQPSRGLRPVADVAIRPGGGPSTIPLAPLCNGTTVHQRTPAEILASMPPNACHAQKTPADQLVPHHHCCRSSYSLASTTGHSHFRLRACPALHLPSAERGRAWVEMIRVAADTQMEHPAVPRDVDARPTWPSIHVGQRGESLRHREHA